MHKITALCVLLTGVLATATYEESIVYSSTAQQTTLLELYTSEGCSSCPPAEQWLSRFKENPSLWKQIIPVAFHVNYWDFLGWRDRFSNPNFSRRQYLYKKHGNVQAVYTPGMTINGREWRGWYGNKVLPSASNTDVGILKAVLNDSNGSVEFESSKYSQRSLILNVALLGFNLESDISAGENSGRKLNHDFVVLSMRKYHQQSDNNHYQWILGDIPSDLPAEATGIALWVTEINNPTPLQSTGGWLQ